MMPRLVLRLRRSLADPLPSPVWPKGIRPIPFEPERHARELHSLLVTSYAQGGGSVDTFDSWWPNLREDSEYDPSLCLIAVDEQDRIAGAAQCWTSAFIKDLVVGPGFRRRGLGSALLLEAFRVFRVRGAAFVDLKVEADNPTGAVRLYRALGFEEIETYSLS